MAFQPLWMWSPARHSLTSLTTEFDAVTSGRVQIATDTTRRHGPRVLRVYGGETFGGVFKNIAPGDDFYVAMGCMWYSTSAVTTISGLSSGNQIVTVRHAGGRHVGLYYGKDGEVRPGLWTNATNFTWLGSGPSATGLFPAGAWRWIEVHFIIRDIGGLVEVRIDGQTVFSFSGDTSYQAAAPPVSQLAWLGTSSGSNIGRHCVQDILVGVGGWPSDTYVLDYVPSGAGAESQFSGLVGAASPAEAVDETGPDGDTSYISDATSGHRHSFSVSPLNASPQSGKLIHGVQVDLVAATGIGVASIRPTLRHGASQAVGTPADLTTAYDGAKNPAVFAAGPSGTWKAAEIAAMQPGVEITANASADMVKLTTVLARVAVQQLTAPPFVGLTPNGPFVT